MLVVGDSSVLITLSLVNQLHLLSDMFGGVFVTQGVYDEVVVRGAGRAGSQEVADADFVHVEQLRDPDAIDDYTDPLSPEDASLIVLAKELNADLILTRDRRLRSRARREGFTTMKPLALFVLAKRRGLLLAVKPLLDELRSTGTLIREGIYRETLREAGELEDD